MRRWSHKPYGFSVLIFVLWAMLAVPAPAAETSRMIAFTGCDDSLTGPVDVRLRLFTDSSGGTMVFEETQTGVDGSSGCISVQIGAATAGGIPPNVFASNASLWMVFALDSDPDTELGSGRTPVIANGYAFKAVNADSAANANSAGLAAGLIAGAVAQGNLSVNGNVGIGTSAPQSRLDIAGGNADLAATEGDFKIGSNLFRLKIGVATAGANAGDVHVRAQGGTSRLSLGSGTNDALTINPNGNIDIPNGDVHIGKATIAKSGEVDISDCAPPPLGCRFRDVRFNVTPDGKVGINFTRNNLVPPLALPARVSVGSTNEPGLALDTGSANAWTALYFLDQGAGRLAVQKEGNNDLGFWTRGPVTQDRWTQRMVLGARTWGTALWLDATATPGGRKYLFQASGGSAGQGPGKLILRDETVGADRLTIDRDGTVSVNVVQITGGSDLSEQFEVTRPQSSGSKGPQLPVEPGMVVSIDPDHPGHLVVSRRAYDHRVAGILSGAGGIKPGMLMGQAGTAADGKHPVALTGRVYAWADAAKDPIEPGDLLTTSNTPGHVMKVKDHAQAQGAILGKAMTRLKAGKGLVLVLVTLQ